MKIDTRFKKILCACLCASFLLNASCSSMITVQPAEFQYLDSRKGSPWRITTNDDNTFFVSTFSISDSCLVIEEFHEDNQGVRTDPRHVFTEWDLPMSISFHDIRSIERTHTSVKEPIIFGLLSSVLICGMLFYYFLSQLDFD